MKKNPYVKTDWEDHIVDIEYGDVIQEGTRFTAKRANNIEEGIYNLYGQQIILDDSLSKIMIQLEMIGRAPINNGTFYDSLDGVGEPKALVLQLYSAISQNALEIGNTEILVNDGSVFKVGDYVTIYDDINIENKRIENILENTITISALENDYKRGAMISRSNVEVKDNKINYQSWGNYSIDIGEVV